MPHPADNAIDHLSAAPPALRSFSDLPGPRGRPLLGNLGQFKTQSAHLQFDQWCREFGPIYKLNLAGRKIVVMGDHAEVAKILRDRPDGFRRTTRLDEIWTEMGLPTGVFGANGEVWKRQRRMVMAGFDPVHVRAYFPSLQGVAQRLSGRWHKAARNATTIDLQSDLMRYTVDTIAGLAFGAEVNTLESDEVVIQQHLDKIFPALFSRIFKPVPLWRWYKSAADRRLDSSLREVMLAVNGFVAQARARMQANPGLREHPSNLLEAMIAAADLPDSGITDDQVAGNVVTMLLAGEDTTANTLAWLIHLLWLNPETLVRATEEVRRVCADPAAPTFEEMAQLDYVEACAHETMRLKPVAPQLPLQTIRETVIGDVRLPPGIVVMSLMRRDSVSEDFLPNAAAFKPERWLDGDGEGHPGHAAHSAKRISMPFGAGPRICPGRYLALLEMKMAMATLLGQFDIASVDTPDGLPAREALNFTMTPVGLSMRLKTRQANAPAY
jgi:cytochrome P450